MPLSSLGHLAITKIGFDVGRDFWESVKREGGRYGAMDDLPRDKRGGKRAHPAKHEIAEKWQRISYEGSSGGRILYGYREDAVAKLARSLKTTASSSTIRKYCPGDLRMAKRPTDLCPIREEGRALNVRFVKRYSAAPAQQEINELETRQSAAKELFRRAIGDTSALANDRDYPALLASERHEELAGKLHAECQTTLKEDADKHKLICAADWAGKVETKSNRQTSDEFFNPTRLEMMGLLISIPQKDGRERKLVYIHAYDLRARVRKNGFRSATAIEECLVVAKTLYRETWNRYPLSIEIWMDTARHFRCKLLMYHMLIASRASIRWHVTLKWFVEHHGKSILDSSFRLARSWVAEYIDYGSVKRKEVTMEKSIIKAYKNGSGGDRPNYKAIFLNSPNDLGYFNYGRRALTIPNVGSVHELSCRKGDNATIAINKSYGGKREIGVRWTAIDVEPDSENDVPPREWGAKQELDYRKTKLPRKFDHF